MTRVQDVVCTCASSDVLYAAFCAVVPITLQSNYAVAMGFFFKSKNCLYDPTGLYLMNLKPTMLWHYLADWFILIVREAHPIIDPGFENVCCF